MCNFRNQIYSGNIRFNPRKYQKKKKEKERVLKIGLNMYLSLESDLLGEMRSGDLQNHA